MFFSERREVPPPKRESRVRVDRSISLRETKQTPNQIDNIDNQKEKKGVQRNQWLTIFDNFKMIFSALFFLWFRFQTVVSVISWY